MWAFELILLIVLATVVVWAMRGGKPALQNPLVIDRPGQLHLTLAPQLAQAQPFIESVAMRCGQMGRPAGDVDTQFFTVRDPAVQREDEYLLAVSWRAGIWYFQAIMPPRLANEQDSSLNNLREFSAAVLAQHPLREPRDDGYVQTLRDAVEGAAAPFNIEVRELR